MCFRKTSEKPSYFSIAIYELAHIECTMLASRQFYLRFLSHLI